MPTNEDIILQDLDNALNDLADLIFEKSQDNLVKEGKVDTGVLLKTANVNKKFLEKEIVYPAEWAEYVEFGRNSGSMPPPDALFPWVKRKLGLTNDAEARSVSFKIALAIKERGIQPVPFLRNAISEGNKEFGF